MGNNNQSVQIIRDRISRAAQRAGRGAEDITLVAVSKTKPIEDIVAAYEAGVRHFGENRTEEFEEKARALTHLVDLKWHFIGHLQTRQSGPVARYAHFFHAVDRIKIAQRLSSQLGEIQRNLPIFIQVNVSGEESKSGFGCKNWKTDDRQVEELLGAIGEIAILPNLEILGLMTMAPFDAQEDTLRDIFRNMAGLSARVQEAFPRLRAQQLSMGMSGDFEIAIEEGATLVRIGSAIFGTRG
ncbi:MAG: hypothetical protein BECKG1743D_GA0114223_108481 [Candidatus Kentron sp. G]|uniref:Pyridoxal phosphate homeostasis protein n=1 Tax=Candidatus Kentrum sp. FM TaxID=2126340 RepID=A0A450VTG4_9GAMM|nr:MAG: hypothetical protein BECKFM1743C_GA0114222_100595 [Candidatus Kentron sp. FM]VFN04212.1 MAG: hypothetical protein BECKG1743F_GA0114225_109021 [Candidatus Kentron sp. G]VFJ50147.1 MAG: hypothetical protein BECKFM1743A_GA0114220_100808 [Candidatus Kentron sp. FM]VFK08084.1 MAG: hypothetical protein BECKFM1743B_GA0114221_100595 [Candidatus Kentron sp. FM]VFN04760.1 MAG: hypothetical protein BECKG1743E_GA0114224_107732 [Candidatus Kentron sp. G]